jgi:ubiquitin C-terminal hydrolase
MYSTTNSTYGSNYYHPPPPPRYGNSTPKPQKPSIYSKTHEIIPTGFSHLANTCYMASILQILFLILPENMKISEGNITKLFF